MVFFDPDNPLAAEILQEAAEAYFAGCKKMAASLKALRAFDRAVASSAQHNAQVGRRSSEFISSSSNAMPCSFRGPRHFLMITESPLK